MAIINSILAVFFSLVYNNLFIRNYGSATNGLISTLNQFVSMFTIIEGGFTTAAIVATYEPIVNKNYDLLNSILYTTKRVFRKIGAIIVIAVLFLGSIYINFIDSPFPYAQTFLLLLISVLSTGFSLLFMTQYSILLNGANKEYVRVQISLVCRCITWFASIILIMRKDSVLLVFSLNLINIFLNTIFLKLYEHRSFPQITYKGTYNRQLIRGTGDVFFQKIANTIFTSTDLVLISVFISLASASVYNLYYQVYKSILTLLLDIAQAPFNSFGQIAAENDREKLLKYFNMYQFAILICASAILTITGVMIIPFIKIYTRKISDYNYLFPSLAILFFMQIFAQVVNRPYGILLNTTGNFKMQNKQCALAAVINIIVSVAFINQLGINSIILGSFVGTLIILVMNIYQAYNRVLETSFVRATKNIVINFGLGTMLIVLSLKIEITPNNYLKWIFDSLISAFVVIFVFLTSNFIIEKETTKLILQSLLRKIKKSEKINI